MKQNGIEIRQNSVKSDTIVKQKEVIIMNIWGRLPTENDPEYERNLLLEISNIGFDAEEERMRLEAEKCREQGPRDPELDAAFSSFFKDFFEDVFECVKRSRNKDDSQKSTDSVQK